MTIWQRILGVIIGLLTIALGCVMLLNDKLGFNIICAILCLTLFGMGIKSLVYYQTMARHMVGGRLQLYKGMVLFNLGVFTLTLNNIPRAYIILYLIGIHLFAGIVDVLRAREAMKMEAPAWKVSLLYGLGNIVMALLCLWYGFVLRSLMMVVIIYSAGLMYSGILRIISSFKKTAIVYIQ